MKSMELVKEFTDFIRVISLELEAVFLPSLEFYDLTLIQSRILIEIYANNRPYMNLWKKTGQNLLCRIRMF